MRIIKAFTTILLLHFFSQPVFAQAPSTSDNISGWWLGTFSKKSLNNHLSGWMETQIRSSFENGQVSQILYRTGLLYKNNSEENHEYGALFGVIQADSNTEHRYTLQHSTKYLKTEKYGLGHRIRAELRDFSGREDKSYRFRYLLRYTYAFKKLTGVLWDEIFLNVSDETSNNQKVLERNRAFIGVRLPALTTHVEIGYLNQVAVRRSGDTIEHLAVLYWFF